MARPKKARPLAWAAKNIGNTFHSWKILAYYQETSEQRQRVEVEWDCGKIKFIYDGVS